jgi:hypothetical protein
MVLLFINLRCQIALLKYSRALEASSVQLMPAQSVKISVISPKCCKFCFTIARWCPFLRLILALLRLFWLRNMEGYL